MKEDQVLRVGLSVVINHELAMLGIGDNRVKQHPRPEHATTLRRAAQGRMNGLLVVWITQCHSAHEHYLQNRMVNIRW